MSDKKKRIVKIRRTWERKPQEQVKNSDKIYKRSKEKQKLEDLVDDADYIDLEGGDTSVEDLE